MLTISFEGVPNGIWMACKMKGLSPKVHRDFILRAVNGKVDMRILLIEDEPKVSALVKRGLTAERYAVDVSADGREGLEYSEAYPYDLILLDLMLPRLSGVEVLQRIRRTNQFVPILVLTARDSVDEKVKLFEIGADD